MQKISFAYFTHFLNLNISGNNAGICKRYTFYAIHLKNQEVKSLRGSVKVNYLKLFLGDEGQDIIDGFNLSVEEIKKLDSYWTKLQQYVRPKSNFRVARAQLRELKQKPDDSRQFHDKSQSTR